MPETILKEATDGRVTVMDVARAAGVSYGVAADILREKTRYTYREETIARVKQTAGELSYRPSRVAQALTSGRTHQIALCLPNFGTSYTTQLIRAFDRQARDTPYDLLIVSHQAMERQDVTADGVLWHGSSHRGRGNSALPTIVFGTSFNNVSREDYCCDTVLVNLKEASIAVMKHYVEQGLQRILLVTSKSMLNSHEPRAVAYKEVMKKAGLLEEIVIFDAPREEYIRERVQKQLQKYFLKKGFPDAMFCSNDDVAIAAYRVLREAGKSIPDQIAVSGCDDIEESQDLSPSLTSIHIPFDEMAAQSWKLLMQRLDKPNEPYQHYSFQADLVIRESSCQYTKN